MPDAAAVIGRFAPSPTGALHTGSLITALASACDVRQRNGIWQLRIDDIDPRSEQAGASRNIPESLRRFGFHWDGAMVLQSGHARRYRQALHRLNAGGLLYPCRCTRRSLGRVRVYPGLCRPSQPTPDDPGVARLIEADGMAETTLRIRLDGDIRFDDAVFGPQSVDIARHTGDVVVKRRDGFFAYHLACVVDDGAGVTRVVRGADLLDSTAVQIAIMRCLDAAVPDYAHIPVAIDANGDKLSKHSRATAIDELPVLPTLLQAWEFLGQSPLAVDSVDAFWSLAPASFRLDVVPAAGRRRLPAAGY